MFGIHIKIPTFIVNAAKTAGHAAHSVTKVASAATGEIGKGLGKIPVVGGAVSGIYDLSIGGPIKFANEIASGARVDKAAFRHLKSQLADVKAVAPYAQSVLTFVPGVGTGVSGIIGASLALASGQNITDALVAGVKDSIPGGPVAKSLFAVGEGVIRGDRVDAIALHALPIPDAAKEVVASSINITKALASGKRVDKIVLDEAYKQLPSEGRFAVDAVRTKGGSVAKAIADQGLKLVPPQSRKALQVGMAVGNARVIQGVTKLALRSPDLHNSLATAGKRAIMNNPVLASAQKLAPKSSHGFVAGIGLMARTAITPRQIIGFRKTLSPIDRKGFDLALSTHIGVTTRKPPAKLNSPMALAGYYATAGSQGATLRQKEHIVSSVMRNPKSRIGVKVAINQTLNARLSLWGKIKKYIGV